MRETLNRRYKFAIRRLAQTNSEDVFSLAMTAFAHEIDPTPIISLYEHRTVQYRNEPVSGRHWCGASDGR
ncbi:hypothetical protein ACNKHS_08230 [Shigella flexneri]